MEICIKCGKAGSHNELSVPKSEHLINNWFCHKCYDVYLIKLDEFNKSFIQPERSKREDLSNELDKFKPKSLNPKDGYFPPPWDINDFPEKTLGWFEFQKAIKEDPKYYLGCGALNSMET